ncbi:MAG: hypothetical protein IKR85_10050 [Clostridia bacterium]|nr:hypothetical protein [Clostridia bacterium]
MPEEMNANTEKEAEQALEKREREVEMRELKLLARQTLADRGLSQELSGILDYSDREACLKSVDSVERALRQEVTRQMDKHLAGRGITLPAASDTDEDALSDREYYTLRGFKPRL